jgi:hypothetical protein
VTYTSPSISGVTLSFQRQLGTDGLAPAGAAQTGGGAAQSYSLTYSNAGFSGAYASSTDATNGDSTIFALSYDFGVAKVNYANLTSTHDALGAAAERTGNQIGVSVPLGALTLGAQFSTNGDNESASSYIANYAISKRTLAYLSSNTAAAGAVTTQVGLKHAF